ncbi:hypothetical protein K0M31_004292 [Melipona bicolor]|uniref:Uncharacterized protein n=1 Tax=Melipona bicolor TaxID=60889 RepID=A0AA40KNC0_9HYME|nr:hypothetical protein K0M31_004292 [Melipona bicolor]
MRTAQRGVYDFLQPPAETYRDVLAELRPTTTSTGEIKFTDEEQSPWKAAGSLESRRCYFRQVIILSRRVAGDKQATCESRRRMRTRRNKTLAKKRSSGEELSTWSRLSLESKREFAESRKQPFPPLSSRPYVEPYAVLSYCLKRNQISNNLKLKLNSDLPWTFLKSTPKGRGFYEFSAVSRDHRATIKPFAEEEEPRPNSLRVSRSRKSESMDTG